MNTFNKNCWSRWDVRLPESLSQMSEWIFVELQRCLISSQMLLLLHWLEKKMLSHTKMTEIGLVILGNAVRVLCVCVSAEDADWLSRPDGRTNCPRGRWGLEPHIAEERKTEAVSKAEDVRGIERPLVWIKIFFSYPKSPLLWLCKTKETSHVEFMFNNTFNKCYSIYSYFSIND